MFNLIAISVYLFYVVGLFVSIRFMYRFLKRFFNGGINLKFNTNKFKKGCSYEHDEFERKTFIPERES